MTSSTGEPAAGLNLTRIGVGSQPMVMMHGLFGQGRNFTAVAKDVAQRADVTVWLVDLPNHGESLWTDEFNIDLFADLVERDLGDHAIGDPIVVGHSLGGRVAMRLALRHPARVRALAIVDIAAGTEAYLGDQSGLIEAMRAIDLGGLDSRADADDALRPAVPDPRVRGFLLQNLRRSAAGWSWQLNLDLLAEQVARLREWPGEVRPYPGPVVWISGARSPYVTRSDDAVMRHYFPLVQQVRLKDAGHWVHADQPKAFADTLVWFANKLSPSSPQ